LGRTGSSVSPDTAESVANASIVLVVFHTIACAVSQPVWFVSSQLKIAPRWALRAIYYVMLAEEAICGFVFVYSIQFKPSSGSGTYLGTWVMWAIVGPFVRTIVAGLQYRSSFLDSSKHMEIVSHDSDGKSSGQPKAAKAKSALLITAPLMGSKWEGSDNFPDPENTYQPPEVKGVFTMPNSSAELSTLPSSNINIGIIKPGKSVPKQPSYFSMPQADNPLLTGNPNNTKADSTKLSKSVPKEANIFALPQDPVTIKAAEPPKPSIVQGDIFADVEANKARSGTTALMNNAFDMLFASGATQPTDIPKSSTSE
jgi:hypothetical protein